MMTRYNPSSLGDLSLNDTLQKGLTSLKIVICLTATQKDFHFILFTLMITIKRISSI